MQEEKTWFLYDSKEHSVTDSQGDELILQWQPLGRWGTISAYYMDTYEECLEFRYSHIVRMNKEMYDVRENNQNLIELKKV